MDDHSAQGPARAAQAAPSRRGSFSWALWVWFFLLVVYPLSTGPVVKLVDKAPLPMEVLYIYYPLGKVSERVPPLNRFFKWYVQEVWKVK